MTNGNDSAFPIQPVPSTTHFTMPPQSGLTKREYFAAMAMQGLFARGDRGAIEMKSVLYAEALIAELNKQP